MSPQGQNRMSLDSVVAVQYVQSPRRTRRESPALDA